MEQHQPVFYYDLGRPQCYLVAERIMGTLSVVPEWEPVRGAEFAPDDLDRAEIERLATAFDLQPLRWPPAWPPDTERAMLAATYAKRIGRAVAFSLAAFRQAFAAGRELTDENTILIAGAACEMHPVALAQGIGLRSTAEALERATRRAQAAGIATLPAIQLGDRIHAGLDAVEDVNAALAP